LLPALGFEKGTPLNWIKRHAVFSNLIHRGVIVTQYVSQIIDQPATYHNGAAGFAFADGHSEIHKWKECLAPPGAQKVMFVNSITAPAKAGDQDIHWLSYRAGRKSEKTF